MSYGITETIGTESARADSLHSVVVPSEKSKTFFAKLLARRQTPGNCVRCGHKNPQPKYKTCPRCLDAVNRRKKAAREKPTVTTRALERRIESLEIAIANLQSAHARTYNRMAMAKRRTVKQAVAKAVRKIQQQDECRYADVMQTITAQELATINHAYDRQ